MVIVNPMKKNTTPDGSEKARPRSHEKRNKIKDYRRQDEYPVERTQDRLPGDWIIEDGKRKRRDI
jgi:hypothetical protein